MAVRPRSVPSDAFDPAEWKLTAAENAELLKRLRAGGIALSEFIGGRALFGLKTGCNEAFVIGSEEVDRIDPDREFAIPVLFGKDVRRYEAVFAGRFVIYLHPERDVADFPTARKYLTPFQRQLEDRRIPRFLKAAPSSCRA